MSNVKHPKYSILENFLFPTKRLKLAPLQKTLKGKTILITGASFGIGAALATMIGLNVKDARLILIGRTTDKLLEIKNKIEKSGGEATVYSVDLRVEDELDGLIYFLQLKENTIDIFVNNAGKSIKRSIFQSLDRGHDFTRTMRINYHAPVKLSLALIPILKEKKGQIINISAINVLFPPMPHWAAYQASKAAFDQWFRSVAPELKAAQIAMSTVYLPLVKTRMIVPTKAYEKMPAMIPKQVAIVISNLIINRKKKFKPWWCIFVEIVAFLFRWPLELLVDYQYEKRRND